MPNNTMPAGFACLRLLMNNLHRDVNFDAMLNDELFNSYAGDDCAALVELAQKLHLDPALHHDVATALDSYHGQALLKLKNGNWIILLSTAQFKNSERVTICDPTTAEGRPINVPKAQIVERMGDAAICFGNLQDIDIRTQTGLFCLCSVARHYGVDMNIQRVMHDYSVGEEEPPRRVLHEIAGDYKVRSADRKLKWEKLIKLGEGFPAIAMKANGRYVVLCGYRPPRPPEGEDAEAAEAPAPDSGDLAVLDPENPGENGNRFIFWSREDYEREIPGKVMLLKRNYRITDENQPFGLRWFIPEFFKLRGIFAQIALMVAMLTIISLAVPLFFQVIVDKVLANYSFNTLNVLGVAVIMAVLFNGFLEYLRSYLLLFATNKIDISTATKTFRHLMKLPIDFFERIPSGVLLKHMQQTEKIRGFLSGNLFFTLLDLCSLVLFVPFLMLYSMTLTGVVIAFSVVMALVIAALIKPFQRRLNELYQAEGKRQSMLVESIHGIRTVKSLALEPVEEKQWDNSTAYAIKSYFRVGKISMAASSICKVLEFLMNIAVIWIGALMVFNYKMSVGELIAFQMLAGRVTGPLVKIVRLIHEYQQVALSVRMLGVVMNTPTEPDGGGVRNPLRGDVAFENVSFQYRPNLPVVVKNMSLHVPVGSTLGIVGRSGSGKTTLTKLLQGLYPVQQGLIKIDGIDLREIDRSHLRSSIGVVLQDNYFFSGSIRDNISQTKRSATLEEIIYVSKLAGADEFIQKMPRGYDTMLEENASNLSGGQRQRLAIARALLNNPPILIFDEATSALDPESEFVIQKNLKSIARGRTVLIISHRLSIVSRADNIIVLDSGELVASGNHDQLMAQPGIYQEFWRQQMERINPDEI
jgi:ATP-binding cassette subfamily B protein